MAKFESNGTLRAVKVSIRSEKLRMRDDLSSLNEIKITYL